MLTGIVRNDGESDKRRNEVNGTSNAAMTMSRRVSATAATVLLCGLQGASAQDTDEITVEIGECIEIEAPVERLACFASQVEQALNASEAAESGDGAEQENAPAADEPVVETIPSEPAETERPAPAEASRAEPASPAVASEQPGDSAGEDTEPASPTAETARSDDSDGQEPEPEAAVAVAVAVVPDANAAADAEDLNWFERRRARRAARAAEREAQERAAAVEAAENEIRATITALRQRGPNSWLITLDNGQIWDQVRPQWYPLRPGQQVRLYPTNWGSSYRLSALERGGYIQVTQVR